MENGISELKKKLCYTSVHIAAEMPEDIRDAEEFCEDYKEFLDLSKTERETVATAEQIAQEAGFVPFDRSGKYKAGQKVYFVNREKSLILVTFGKKPLAEGVRFVIAHGDCPRLDLKASPVYEKDGTAFLKTHYYGGIRKYQWTTVPLSLHGVVILKNGKKVSVCIGEKDTDPRFVISDLLPHLSMEQNERKLSEGVKGEELNIIFGNIPFGDEDTKDPVKLCVLNILYDRYGITEKDLLTAELEAVPAVKACDIGLDRSMIGGYGQDDRSCVFASVSAQVMLKKPEHTAVTVIADKEEIGSCGNTGMESLFLYDFMQDLCETQNAKVRDVYRNSICLSADVGGAFDPTFRSAFEENNSAFLGHGPVIQKYTGARGKSGASDASAETFAGIVSVLEENGVIWQTGELGKVDGGGGGTVAKYMANMDVDTIDIGVPVLSMHAPFEVTSKLDVYHTHKAVKAFLES